MAEPWKSANPNKMRWNQKVTNLQKKDLINWAAGAGENYERYLDFCARHDIPVFARGYWRNFVQRHRRIVQAIRQEHILTVAKEARMGRKARIEMLEADAARCEDIIAKSGPEGDDSLSVDQLARMMDQKRRTLESIAKEMGEWGTPPEDEGGRGSSNPLIAVAEQYRQLVAGQAAQDEKDRAEATEGVYSEVP